MGRTKYKVGDIVNVRHIGMCEVKHVFIAHADKSKIYYVLKRGTEIFSVGENEITGKQGAEPWNR